MTFKDGRLGTWVRSNVALDEKNLKKAARYINDTTSSLQFTFMSVLDGVHEYDSNNND